MKGKKEIKSLLEVKKSFFLFFFVICSCQSSVNRIWEKAQEADREKNFKEAFLYYEKVFKRLGSSNRGLIAVNRSADIAYFYLKNFKKARSYYQYILVHSGDREKKTQAQERLAELNFSIFNNYEQAIFRYNQLIKINKKSTNYNKYKLQIARSYFFMNSFYQARVEVEEVTKEKDNNPYLFEGLLLLGNIYLAEKKTEKAIEVLLSLAEKFPKKSIKENVLMTVALSYEELKKFDKAIEILESIVDKVKDSEFINSRIKNLSRRKKDLPGARGLKK